MTSQVACHFQSRGAIMPASKIVSIFFVALAVMTGGRAQGASSDSSSSVSPTWEKAYVMISGSLVGSGRRYLGGEVRDGAMARHLDSLDPKRAIPVVVAMSGSAGDTTDLVRFAEPMMDLGLVFVILDSRARGRDWIDCWRSECGEGRARKSLGMRIEEAEFAFGKLTAFSWAAQSKLVLMGFSWGAMATALYPRDDYDARMILAWTCTAQSWSWLNGLHGSLETPVFSAVAASDPTYAGAPWARGHCPTHGRPQSKSLVLESAIHNVMTLLEVKQEAHGFLWKLFSDGNDRDPDSAGNHALAPLVIEKSAEQIILKPVGSTQAVYKRAQDHCEEFGKMSFLVRTMADGGSYAFVCE